MKLADRIWWTRKARIQASKRLESNGLWSGIMLSWYSLVSVASSIYYLSITPNNNLPLVAATTYSVLVLTLSIIVSGQNFRSRAVMMKNCYLQLERLYIEVALLDVDSLNQNDLILLEERYQNIIESSENHNEFDYYYTILKEQSSGGDINKEIRGLIKFQTIGELIVRKIVWWVAAAVPLVLFYWILNLS